MFSFLLILYILIAILVELVKAVHKAFVDARRQRSYSPVDYLRLLKRLRRNGYRETYLGRSREGKTFAGTVCKMYQQIVVGSRISEQLFYRYLSEMISRKTYGDQLTGSYYQKYIIAFFSATSYWYNNRVRSPETWKPREWTDPEELTMDLVSHLFELYEVPPALASIWWYWQDEETRAFCEGYTHIGYREGVNNALFKLYFAMTWGESMRQYEAFTFPISRRIASFYYKTSIEARFDEAYWWCVYMAAGGNEKHAWSVSKISFRFEQREFWNAFLRWLAQTEESCKFPTRELLSKLVDLVELARFGTGRLMEHEAYRAFARVQPGLKLTGQTPWSLLRRLDRMMRPEFPRLPGLRDSYVLRQDEDALICLVRLKDGLELEEEGAIMGHCVGDGGYEMDCLEGHISIWSLRKERQGRAPERLLTIELAGTAIEEMQGPGNRQIAESYFRLVRKWVEEHVPKN